MTGNSSILYATVFIITCFAFFLLFFPICVEGIHMDTPVRVLNVTTQLRRGSVYNITLSQACKQFSGLFVYAITDITTTDQ